MSYFGDKFAGFRDKTLDGIGVKDPAAKKDLGEEVAKDSFPLQAVVGVAAGTFSNITIWAAQHGTTFASRYNDAFMSGAVPALAGVLAATSITTIQSVRNARKASVENERLRQQGINPELNVREELKRLSDECATKDELATAVAEAFQRYTSESAAMRTSMQQLGGQLSATQSENRLLVGRVERLEAFVNDMHFRTRDVEDKLHSRDELLAVHHETLSRQGHGLVDLERVTTDHAARLDEDVRLLARRRGQPNIPESRAGPAARPAGPAAASARPAPPAPPDPARPGELAPGWGPAQGGVRDPLPPPSPNGPTPPARPNSPQPSATQPRRGRRPRIS